LPVFAEKFATKRGARAGILSTPKTTREPSRGIEHAHHENRTEGTNGHP
jgi:hypothetical protein